MEQTLFKESVPQWEGITVRSAILGGHSLRIIPSEHEQFVILFLHRKSRPYQTQQDAMRDITSFVTEVLNSVNDSILRDLNILASKPV